MTKRQQFTVQDRDRSFVFNGYVLGHASSKDNTRQRWTEMTIYVTEAGKYIVAGAGQSTVKKGDVVWDDRTGKNVKAANDETVRAWVHVCESAEGVIQSLYLYDSDNVRYMTKIARQALVQAITVDDALKQAFTVEEVA